jgi:hypothetical protein
MAGLVVPAIPARWGCGINKLVMTGLFPAMRLNGAMSDLTAQ